MRSPTAAVRFAAARSRLSVGNTALAAGSAASPSAVVSLRLDAQAQRESAHPEHSPPSTFIVCLAPGLVARPRSNDPGNDFPPFSAKGG